MDMFSTINTTSAARYLGSLCQHFGHKIPVKRDGQTGQIEFPFGQCILTADDVSLTLQARAETQDALDKTVEVVTIHLERFAFRENPEISWQSA